jgi:transposase
MVFPSSRVRLLVAIEPVDYRKGHDGLTALAQTVIRKDPFTGTVLRLRAKRMDRLKLLDCDGSGLVMACKRREDTTFPWPATQDGTIVLVHAQFEASFSGLAPSR